MTSQLIVQHHQRDNSLKNAANNLFIKFCFTTVTTSSNLQKNNFFNGIKLHSANQVTHGDFYLAMIREAPSAQEAAKRSAPIARANPSASDDLVSGSAAGSVERIGKH